MVPANQIKLNGTGLDFYQTTFDKFCIAGWVELMSLCTVGG